MTPKIEARRRGEEGDGSETIFPPPLEPRPQQPHTIPTQTAPSRSTDQLLRFVEDIESYYPDAEMDPVAEAAEGSGQAGGVRKVPSASPLYRRTPPPSETDKGPGPPDYFDPRNASGGSRSHLPFGDGRGPDDKTFGEGAEKVRYADDTLFDGDRKDSLMTAGGSGSAEEGSRDDETPRGMDVYMDDKDGGYRRLSNSRSGPMQESTVKFDLPTPSDSPLLTGSSSAEMSPSAFLPGSRAQNPFSTTSAPRSDPTTMTSTQAVPSDSPDQTMNAMSMQGFATPPSTAPSSEAEGPGGAFGGDDEEDDFDWSKDEEGGGEEEVEGDDSGSEAGDGKMKVRKTLRRRMAPYRLLKPIFTTFLGNLVFVILLVAPAIAVRFTLGASGDENSVFVADNVEAWMYWIAFNLGSSWGVHFLMESLPKIFIFFVEVVWGNVSEGLRSRVEIFQAAKKWIRYMIYGGTFWGSFAVIFNTIFNLRDDNNPPNSRAQYTYRLYQVVDLAFFLVLVMCIEKLFVLLISLNFHSVAYAERIKDNVKTLAVLDILKDWRPKAAKIKREKYSKGVGARIGSPPPSLIFRRPGFSRTGSYVDTVFTQRPENAGVERQRITIVSTPKPVHGQRVMDLPDVVEGDEELGMGYIDSGRERTGGKWQRGLGSSRSGAEAKGAHFGLFGRKSGAPSSGRGGSGGDGNVEAHQMTGLRSFTLGQSQQREQSESGPVLMSSRSSTLDTQAGMKDGEGDGFEDGVPLKRPGMGGRKNTDLVTKSLTKRTTTAAAIARLALKDPVATLRREKGGIGLDITSPAQAKRLARNLFWSFRADSSRKYLVASDFYPAFKSVKEAQEAFKIFDKDGNGDISRAEIKSVIMQAYKERRFLARSLQDMSQAIGTLDGLLVVVALIILLFIALGVFNIDITQSLTTFYSLALAAGFIFKNTAQVLFDSIIFLFVTHSFDSGDRIVLSTLLGPEILLVKKMGLLGTIFTRSDGTEIWVSNALLSTMFITNYRRSGNQFESATIEVAWNTPLSKLEELEKKMNHWLETDEKRMFEPSTACVIQSLDYCNSMTVTLGMTHRGNWQDWNERWVRRTAFHIAVAHYSREIGINCTKPVQPVQYWQSDLNTMPPAGSDAEVDSVYEGYSAMETASAVEMEATPIEPAKAKPFLGFVAPEGQTGLRKRKVKSRKKAFRGEGAG